MLTQLATPNEFLTNADFSRQCDTLNFDGQLDYSKFPTSGFPFYRQQLVSEAVLLPVWL